MKTKFVSTLLIPFFILTVNLPVVFAQDYTTWSLPVGAKARLGKGGIGFGIAYSPKGSHLAVVSSIGIWLYDAETYQESALLTHLDSVLSVAFSPDGLMLAGGSSDKTVRLWDGETGEHKHTLQGHTESVWSVAFNPDRRTLASGSSDKTIRLWDGETGEHKHTLQGHTERVWSVAFNPDGRTLASGSSDKTIRLWDAVTGEHKQTLEGHTESVWRVVFSPDGRTLASGSRDNSIRLWDAETGAHKQTLQGHTGYVWSVAFSPDGQTLASGSWDKTIRLWDAGTGQLKHTLEGIPGIEIIVAFSPDGRTLASGANGTRTIDLWDAETGEHKQTLQGHTKSFYNYSVAFSPDGRTLAGSGEDTGITRLWDAETGQPKHILHGDTGFWINSVAFSSDRQTLASASFKAIRLWDAVTGEHKQTLKGHTTTSVAFSPDGQTLASGGTDLTIRLWDAVTGEHKQTLEGHDWIGLTHWVDVAFSPDGRTLASGSSDKTIRLWDAVTGEHKQTLRGHVGNVYSVAFSPDGRTLASGSSDKTIRLWDAVTGEHKQTLRGHVGNVYSVAFSPDGRTLASGSSDGTVLLWHITPTTPTDAVVHISAVPVRSPNFGDLLTLPLKITNGKNVAGYQVTVSYDPAVFRYVESSNGYYLPADTIFVPPVVERGKVTLEAISRAGESHGDGTLATLTFEILAIIKSSTLKLSDVKLVASNGARMLPQTENTEILMIQDAQAVEPNGKHYTKWGQIKTTEVFQNYPNPFNPETWIPYQLAAPADVTLRIYSVDAELIRTLTLERQAAGIYQRQSRAVYWDGKNESGESVASGIYFYTFSTGDFTTTRKMLLRK